MAKKNPTASQGASEAPATQTYRVGGTPILLDGERYESGDAIELTEAKARGLDVRLDVRQAPADTESQE
ncbi:hypothetical protein HNQ51_001721 [Inhella inkyongensis]|uniref:Uncharacterized protein n=1 Tax=Inhella inkyongensis TaxID=392593 RepID=A0A840S025_9BURK|nr:hypothetical protein [Inhella inkyongensis]MBB5204407.1 hypothetical protein [Inhella inkyongensis]